MSKLNPDNCIFTLISFEGPDLYCRAGGLGVRVAELSEALADQGFETHLFFLGDPKLPADEVQKGGKLHLHRWCQWISSYHPKGVYDGEDRKVYDFEKSLPPHLVFEVLKPAIKAGKTVCVLTEDWHTVSATINISDFLYYQGIRDKAVILWNANNIYGFEKFDWDRLKLAATITTVSRYMKFMLWNWGTEALVIPNGIPGRMLKDPDPKLVKGLNSLFPDHSLLVKVGRYSPDKGWIMAVEALAELKKQGKKFRLLMRGGMEPHRGEVMQRAQELGLNWAEVAAKRPQPGECLDLIAPHKNSDIIELNFFVPEEFLCAEYAAGLAVLANSVHEPFGIVGLEVMACGGLPVLGGTGEDYARHMENSMVMDARNYRELAYLIEYLGRDPQLAKALKQGAGVTAREFTWDKVIAKLLERLELGAVLCGARI